MSLQDKIFDIAAVLKGKPEAKSFDEICEYLNQLEISEEHLCEVARPIYAIAKLVKEINE